MTDETPLYKKSLQDFFTKKFLLMSTLPFILTSGILFILLFQFVGELSTWFETHQAATGPNVDWSSITAILKFIFGFAFVQWLLTLVIYFVGSFAVILLTIVIAVVVIGFFTPIVVQTLANRHYPHLQLKGHGNLLTTLMFTLKTLMITLFLLILFIPLYFIPIIGVIALHFPIYYLFHKLLVFDVASTLNTKEEYKIIRQDAISELRINTFFLFLFSLIPFVGITMQIFFVIVLSHIFFEKTLPLRQNDKATALPH
jgi:hypothetical protein